MLLGAATAGVADDRLVEFTQYLRVLVMVLLAPLAVRRLAGAGRQPA